MTNHSIPIFTIGHGNRSVGELIDLLRANQIDFLIDVRPLSLTDSHAAFAKEALTPALTHQSMRYVDMRDSLGVTPDGAACYTGNGADYAEIRASATYQQGIARLQKAFDQGQRVVLLGIDARPAACHRVHLIGATLTERNVPVMHIDESGQLQSQQALLQRAHREPTPEPPDFPPPPPWDEFEGMPPDAIWDDLPADDEWMPPPPSVVPRMPLATYDSPQDALSQVFGYDQFRPLQEEIVTNILARRDTLVIMPTGGGKSLCYQLPALLLDGLTLVVSPLIALMQDQVAQLQSVGVAAAFLNSTLAAVDYHATMLAAKQGNLKLLYMAPETLLRPDILAMLAQCRLQLLAIDEAHCISGWGHDFRPEYRQLVSVRQRFPDAVCVALTATATPRVQEDIKQSLGFREENEFVSTFNRTNLFIAVQPKVNIAGQVMEFLNERDEQSGIIYCATQRKVEDLAATLNANGVTALPYHAGMDAGSRSRNQRAFMVDDVRVIVATVAFGMGIDKPDVRFVLHIDLPKDVESYYQQIGRAGRDGDRADCLLLFGYGDVHTIQHFIEQGAAGEMEGRQRRLQMLVNWAETNDCRRRDLLGYFGETYTVENCEMCDNCVQPAQEQVDITVAAQKFLSCVVRTGERFGQGHIIGVLRGSRAQNIRKWQHERLSTYGIGQEYSESMWKYLVNQFIQQGLLSRDLTTGGLGVTEAGWAVMRGQQVMGHLQEERYGRGGDDTPMNYEIALFSALRNQRKALADAENVPPYVIFADRSLQEMATYFPHSPESFATMHGVGQAKVARFADIFLPIIISYCREHDLEERPKQGSKPKVVRVGSLKSRSDEVGELFDEGQSLDQIAEHFNVKRQTVISNLVKYVDAGNVIDSDRLRSESTLPATQLEQVLAAFHELGDLALRPIFEAMGGQVEYDEIHLGRLIYRLERVG